MATGLSLPFAKVITSLCLTGGEIQVVKLITVLTELLCDQTYDLGFTPNKDSNQPVHPYEESLGHQLPFKGIAKSGQMPRLI